MTLNKIVILVFGVAIFILLIFIYQYNRPYKVQSFYDNGALEAEYTLVNDYKHGEYLGYYPSGEIKRRYNYSFGQIHGRNIEYYEDGSTALVFLSKKGQQEGLCRQYFNNGEVSYYGYYVRDRRVGVHGWYYNDGKLRRIIEYDSTGLETGYYDYDKEGNLDSLKVPYFIPSVDSDSIPLESPYIARIFLGNREKDSLKIEISDVWINDSLVKSDTEILELNRYHADYKMLPTRAGVYKFYVSIDEFDSLGLFSKTDFIYVDTLSLIN